jgi:DNA repair exonuclease SbcCD nuclease subunit
MKYIFVGDPHVKISNLEESQKLLDFVVSLYTPQHEGLVLLGDLFDTHDIVRLRVIDFWLQNINKLSLFKNVFVLRGNHDQEGSYEREESFSAVNLLNNVSPNIVIIDKPTAHEGLFFMPYKSKEKDFREMLPNLPKKFHTLICHQTFDGSKYESGIWAPDAFSIDLPFKNIISGHLHSTQEFANVFYPGTAKWETRSDANLDKGVWEIDFGKDGFYTKKLLSTKDVVTPIIETIIKEGEDLPILPQNAKNYIELVGASKWIEKTKEKYRGLASIKTTPKDTKLKLGTLKKGLNLEGYLDLYFESSIDKLKLKEYLKAL